MSARRKPVSVFANPNIPEGFFATALVRKHRIRFADRAIEVPVRTTASIHERFLPLTGIYSYLVKGLEYAFFFHLDWQADQFWPEPSAWMRSFGGTFIVEYDAEQPESHRFVVPPPDLFPRGDVIFMGAYPFPFKDPMEIWSLIDTRRFDAILDFVELDAPPMNRALDLVLREEVYVLAACLAYSHGRDDELWRLACSYVEQVRSRASSDGQRVLGPLLWLLANVYRRGLAEASPQRVRSLRRDAVAFCRARRLDVTRKTNHDKLASFRRSEMKCASCLHHSPEAPVEDGAGYRSPDGSRVLAEYDGEGLGWGHLLQDEETGRFWFMEVDGPEHGVSIYGPFQGYAREHFVGLRRR